MFRIGPDNENRGIIPHDWRSALETAQVKSQGKDEDGIIAAVSAAAEQTFSKAREGSFYSVFADGTRPLGFRGDTKAAKTIIENRPDIVKLINEAGRMTGNTPTLMRDELYAAYVLTKRIAEHGVTPQSPLFMNAQDIANIEIPLNENNKKFIRDFEQTKERIRAVMNLASIDQRILILKQIARTIALSPIDWSGSSPFAVYFLTPSEYLRQLLERRSPALVIQDSAATVMALWNQSDIKRAEALTKRRNRP